MESDDPSCDETSFTLNLPNISPIPLETATDHETLSNNDMNSPFFTTNDLSQSQLRNQNRSDSLPDNFSAVFNNHDQALSGLSQAFDLNNSADNNPANNDPIFAPYSSQSSLSNNIMDLDEALDDMGGCNSEHPAQVTLLSLSLSLTHTHTHTISLSLSLYSLIYLPMTSIHA